MPAISPIDAMIRDVDALKTQIEKALPQHVAPERWMRTCRTYLRTNGAKLVECERNSLLAAIMKGANTGLNFDGEEASIIPRGKKGSDKKSAQFMAGYQGYLKLIRNSGEVAAITVKVVYAGDDFDRWTDEEGEHLTHREKADSDQSKITHAYMITKTKSGARYVEVMTQKDLAKVRKYAGGGSDAWNAWEEQMSKKSVIRRGYKLLPKSTDIDRVMVEDEEQFNTQEGEREEVQPVETPEKNKPKRLKEAVQKATAEKNPPKPADDPQVDEAPEPEEEFSQEVPV